MLYCPALNAFNLTSSLHNEFRDDQWLKDLFDHAHDLIQIVYIDGTTIYVNKSWSALLEYTQNEIQGTSIYSFIYEPDLPFYKQYRQRIIDGALVGTPIVVNLKSKGGKLIPVEGVISVKHEKGKPLYTRGIFRDISARLQTEAQLKQLNKELGERERNLQQLLINAPDPVIVIDKESHITFWNPKAEAIFGWRSEEVIHQPLQSFIIPTQYRDAHEKGMKRYLVTGEGPVLNKTIEITALRKSGEEFYVALTISPTSQHGQAAFIAFIRDITEQKHNQLELERKTKELEQFIYISHHDLQEPLRKISMFSDMIKGEDYRCLSEASQKRLDKVTEAAQRMSTALKDVLNFASLSKEEQFVTVDLNNVLKDVTTDLELLIAEKKVILLVDPQPIIKAVPQQMHQLFYNVMNNALKFSNPNQTPVIHITCKALKASELAEYTELNQSKLYYKIAIQDNGIGFNQDAANKIFGMFQRLHSKAEYAGTGIGLALCKKVVLNHAGTIWAESKPGEGATFHVLLPAE
jgi:PAS domain S-box-containing protein